MFLQKKKWLPELYKNSIYHVNFHKFSTQEEKKKTERDENLQVIHELGGDQDAGDNESMDIKGING